MFAIQLMMKGKKINFNNSLLLYRRIFFFYQRCYIANAKRAFFIIFLIINDSILPLKKFQQSESLWSILLRSLFFQFSCYCVFVSHLNYMNNWWILNSNSCPSLSSIAHINRFFFCCFWRWRENDFLYSTTRFNNNNKRIENWNWIFILIEIK